MTIYIFITVSGCVGRGPVHCFAPWAYNAVKTAVVYTMLFIVFFVLLIFYQLSISFRSRRCRDRMVVGFTSTFAIGAYHH